MTTYIVAAYDCSMCWGGPEEGGWWYDAGELVRTLKTFRLESAAFDFCRRLNMRLQSRTFGPNAGKHDYTSVLSEGDIQAAVYENYAPAIFPEARPRYQ